MLSCREFRASAAQANLTYINRNAVACLLGLADHPVKAKKALVLDLRRPDERTLYGTIHGEWRDVASSAFPPHVQIITLHMSEMYYSGQRQHNANIGRFKHTTSSSLQASRSHFAICGWRRKHLKCKELPPGTVHVPTDEVASALSASGRQWKERYRCDKPGHSDPIVMQCRTNRRAAWAAQIAQDAGLTNSFVYKQVSQSVMAF